MAAQVRMYRTPTCFFCSMANRLLSQKGVRFEEIDVTARPDLRKWLSESTGQHTVPQIFINDRPIGGFDELSALDARGLLDQMLAEPAGDDA